MPSYPVRPPAAKANLVQAFRGETRAPLPLHAMERALVVVASLHLCLLPWAMGGRSAWAQAASGALGLVALVVALLPRRYSGELAPEGAFTLHPFPRLLRFPVFWLGLLFLGYVACQALNPAWLRVTAGHYWWISPLAHLAWLPSGVKAPFENMNAWRMLCFWGGAWALGCALWTAITRRAAAQAILTVLVINGVVLALVGILQKVTAAKAILWSIKAPATYFVSTFVYKNHGGAYFNLILVLAAGLMAWHYVRALRRLERSSPAPVYAFALVVLGVVVFMSGSRTAMLLLAGFLVVGSAVFLVWRLKTRETTTHPTVTGLVVAGAIVFIAASAAFLNLDSGIDQIKRLADQDRRASIDSRVLARQATLDLFEQEPLFGWGAGGFRHAFPSTQKNYADIFLYNDGTMLGWDHAHNDYVQALAELGVVGFVFPVLALGFLVFRFCRVGAPGQPGFLLLLLGLGLPLAHSWVDFPLYNCAIFTTYCAVWVLVVRWAELENSR